MPIEPGEYRARLQEEFLGSLKRHGITPERLAAKLDEELEATETKVFHDATGIHYSNPLVAWKVRQQARIDAQKLFGLYPPEQREVSGSLRIEQMTDEELDRRIAELEQEIGEAATSRRAAEAQEEEEA